MFQIVFSKIYLFFLSPANWFLLLLLFAFIFRKTNKKRPFLITAIIILFVFGNQVVYNRVMMQWQDKPVDLRHKKYAAGIILGGLSWVEEKQMNLNFFSTGSDRFIQTLKLYKQGVISKIIISAGGGGVGFVPNEAAFLKKEFIDLGVQEADLLIENKSSTTYENAVFSKKFLDSLKIQDSIVLITSAIHLRRATGAFKKQGTKVVPFPCDFERVNVQEYFTDYFVPDFDILNRWKFLTKEWVGIIAYKINQRV